MPFGSGTSARLGDTQPIIEAKILAFLNANGVGGGGSVNPIRTYEGDPNGNVEAHGPAVCVGIGATAGAIWYKTSAGTDSVWTQHIAP
jgi:hypothetical protein